MFAALARSHAWPFFLLFGLYLTCHGYHSRDGDQAYRLPLLLDRQDASLFASDPFVRAFDAFNPHRGSLVVLDASSRLVGLSLTLFGFYGLTYALTCLGIGRLACSVGAPPVLAVAILLLTRAGNIGTNHLFEPEFLDRLLAFGLGWIAFGAWISGARSAPGIVGASIGAAAWIHPSMGLQLGALVGSAWGILAVGPASIREPWRRALAGLACLAVGLLPAVLLQAGQGAVLFEGMPRDEFVLIEAYVQSPQHLVPHLWRASQWMAWACFPILAVLAMIRGPWTSARGRGAVVLGLNLRGLGLAYGAVEIARIPQVILFQPFRMATVARGLALMAFAPRLAELLQDRRGPGVIRAAVVIAGLTGDWALVVATAVELSATAADRWGSRFRWLVPGVVLAYGLWFLGHHDTELGHRPMLAALALAVAWRWIGPLGWTPRRARWALLACWIVPLGAWFSAILPPGGPSWLASARSRLVERCRFLETPTDDMERLAVWCRTETPEASLFVGPPQPKTFRLWAHRPLAFNRSGTPYHAAGLADWLARFRDHVGFEGTNAEFASAYLRNRQALESRYQAMTDSERAELAIRQGADYLIASPPKRGAAPSDDRLEWLHSEGRYAVYRVRDDIRIR
ncbi:MAG: DUF6798 domain-containing protein [Isosphaeraceae bacterium]